MSKLGYCSRTEAERLIAEGRVCLDRRKVSDPNIRVDPARARIEVDGSVIRPERKVYLMVNKPRGVVTTRVDPQNRPTVYSLLNDLALPFVAPVGRLDKASEGLLLMSNDTRWSQHILDPRSGVEKTYHVQVNQKPPPRFLAALEQGLVDRGEHLSAKRAQLLRAGERNAWLEIVIDEGRNRQIRRLIEAAGADVMRLVRIAVGPLQLGPLEKGSARLLTQPEAALFGRPSR